MTVLRVFFSAWICAFILSPMALSQPEDCPHISFSRALEFDFTPLERTMVCGSESPPWNKIPLYQARYHLEAILQHHGYHRFRIKKTASQLEIDPGPISKIKEIRISSPQIAVPNPVVWKVLGKKSTSENFDQARDQVSRFLKENGIPCPEIQTTFENYYEVVKLEVRQAVPLPFPPIERAATSGIFEKTWTRFQAFQPGHPFDQRKLDLTESRIEGKQVANVSYQLSCSSKTFKIRESIFPYPLRFLRFGVGVNSEEGLIGQAGLSVARIDEKVSSVHLQLEGSFVQQSLTAWGEWFPSKSSPMVSLQPSIELERKDDPRTRQVTLETSVLLSKDIQTQSFRHRLGIGPLMNKSFILERDLMDDFDSSGYFAVVGRWKMTDFRYELYKRRPTLGSESEISTLLTKKDFGSPFSAFKLSLSARRFWEIGDYRPAQYALGVRLGVDTTHLPRSQRDSLLPDFQAYLGGSQNLRGFDRKQLPALNEISLTGVSWGSEFHFLELLPWNLDTYAFIDFGLLGDEFLRLQNNWFYSPGVGLLLDLPFGIIDTYFAYGLHHSFDQPSTSLPIEGPRIYLSFGHVF